jgi:hypothetical protein
MSQGGAHAVIAAMPVVFGGSVRRRFRGLGWGLVAAGVIAVSMLVIIGAISAHGDVAFNRWVGWATIIALPFAAIGIVLVLVEKIGRDRDRDRERTSVSASGHGLRVVQVSEHSAHPSLDPAYVSESIAHQTAVDEDVLNPVAPTMDRPRGLDTGETPGFSGGDKGHVFISYARADGSEHALGLERALRIEGFTTWLDVRDIDLSADFTSEIENAIKSAVAVVLCVTQDISRPDSFVRREIAFAKLANRPVVVARFADIPPPISVASNTYLDFHISSDIALAQLLQFLRRRNSASEGLPETARNSYLASLYHEIIDRLDDAIILPVIGRRMRLLEASGLIASADVPSTSSEVLSSRYFRPAYGPIAGAGIRRAFDHARRRMAVVGAPGAGKTITLMILARDLASEAITDPDKPIPLLVSAASWQSDATEERSLCAWLANEVPVLADSIVDLIRSQKVILLVDGLDELPPRILKSKESEEKQPRKDLIRALPQSGPLVIASRPREFEEAANELEVRTVFELQPLTDAQVSTFVAELPNVAAVLRQDDELRVAARTPLMLSLICSALDTARRKEVGHLTPPEARDLIIGNYIESRYERESRRWKNTGDAPPPLEGLYRGLGSLAMSDAGGGGNRNLFSGKQVQSELSSDAYALVLNANIMIVTRSRAVRFYHLAFRDHFAFRYAQAALHDPDPIIRDRAAWALWEIPDRRVVDLLIEALTDPYPYARGSAASALGRIGDHRAIAPLTKLLADETPVMSMYGSSIAEVARHAITQIRKAR